jgi:hypothetical protein
MKAIRASEKLASAESKKAAKDRRLAKKLITGATSTGTGTSATTAAAAPVAVPLIFSVATAAEASVPVATRAVSSKASAAASSGVSVSESSSSKVPRPLSPSAPTRKRAKTEEAEGVEKATAIVVRTKKDETIMQSTTPALSVAPPKRKRAKKALEATKAL